MLAAQEGKLEVVQFLLEQCDPEDVMHQANDGATVYHIAAGNS